MKSTARVGIRIGASASILALSVSLGFAQSPDCAISPSPHPVHERQPDGRSIELFLRGSASCSWHVDARGYPVLRRGDTWFHAVVGPDGDLLPTTLRVGHVDPRRAGLRTGGPSAAAVRRRTAERSLGKGLASPRSGVSSMESAGGLENLVILLRFADHGPSGQNRTLPTSADVDTIMNAPGGDPGLAPTGSVRDVYLEASYGEFELNSTASGWYDVPGTEAYYADGSSGASEVIAELIVDGLNAADPFVDFSLFDEDENGVIDAVTFLHSGYGAEWGGLDVYGTDYVDRIWSHKWSIATWVSAEGVAVEEYNISPGLWDTSGSDPGRIGVIAHEMGHFIGLPDTYDTDGTSVGDGYWCLMAGGSWGFDSSQQYPTHPSAWAKWKMGWVAAPAILPGAYTAGAVESLPDVFRIQSGYPPGECILIENRQPIGFDALVPQAGLAIWHIDDAKGSIASNDVNQDEGYPTQPGWPTNDNHYRIALLQADDFWDLELWTNPGDGGDVYHEAGVAEIVSTSSPNLYAYQGGIVYDTGNEITDIETVPGGISFVYVDLLTPVITPSPLVFAVAVEWSSTLKSSGGSGPITWSETIAQPSYSEISAGQSLFVPRGAPQGWQADDATWSYGLPFRFPFHGETYDTVYVSSNGFLDFVPCEPEPHNQASHLKFAPRIAPFWADLSTAANGDDIFIDVRQGEVEFRWRAIDVAVQPINPLKRGTGPGNPCNFSVVLGQDGSITFHYGQGNRGLRPTVGISRGQGAEVLRLSGYDGSPDLSDASSHTLELSGSQLPPGLTLDSSGRLTGTPLTTGTFRPILRAADAQYSYDEREFVLHVIPRGRLGVPGAAPRGLVEKRLK